MDNSFGAKYMDEMSHEIRNSLNIVIGSSELMKSAEKEEQSELIEVIYNSSMHLKGLLNTYLLARKVQESPDSFEEEEVRFYPFLEELSTQYSLLSQKSGIQFKLDVDSDLPEKIRLSKTKVTQVLNNLFCNAMSNTETGQIQMQVRVISESEDGFRLRFEMKDTGSGISAENQKKLFQEFAQVNRSKTGKTGTGLGLMITRKLIQSMGSDIAFRSEEGVGSVFYFELDLLGQKTYPSSPTNQPIERVLVLDDQEIIRAVTAKQLRKLNVDFDLTSTYEQAVSLLESTSYSAILLDKNLSEIDGLGWSEDLKRKYPAMKIILMTGEELALSEHKLSVIGISKVLMKPFTLEQLTDALHSVEVTAWLSI